MKKKSESKPIYKQIKSHLNILIQNNMQYPEQPLPSENQLAAEFKVSRIPVIQAMRELEEEGKIKRIRGKGSFINTDYLNDKHPKMKFALIIPQVQTFYCLRIIDGIKSFLSEKNIMLHICMTNDDPEQEEAYIKSLLSLEFQGILLFPIFQGTYSNTILKLTISKFPVIFISRNMPHLDISSVLCNPYDQAYHAVEYLHNKGHKNILFIGENPKDDFFYDKRQKGFVSAMKYLYHNENPSIYNFDLFEMKDDVRGASINQEIIAFLNNNPDCSAILASNIANYPISQHLEQMGSALPRKTIVLFDTAEHLKNIENHDIIVLNQNPYKIGYTAAEQLYNQIVNHAPITSIAITETFEEQNKDKN